MTTSFSGWFYSIGDYSSLNAAKTHASSLDTFTCFTYAGYKVCGIFKTALIFDQHAHPNRMCVNIRCVVSVRFQRSVRSQWRHHKRSERKSKQENKQQPHGTTSSVVVYWLWVGSVRAFLKRIIFKFCLQISYWCCVNRRTISDLTGDNLKCIRWI